MSGKIRFAIFFKKYCGDFFVPKCANSLELFCSYLKGKRILDSRSNDIKPTKMIREKGFMAESSDFVFSANANEFRELILTSIKKDKIYTWKQALDKTKIKEKPFFNALIKLNIWDKDKSEFKQKAYKKFIKKGFFTNEVLKSVKNYSNDLKNIEHTFFIQWVGPFASLDECSQWEKYKSISNKEYNFYYAMGKLPYGKKTNFYIGKSELREVCQRMKQESDPVSSFRDNASLEIWIGRFSNSDFRSQHTMIEIAEWAVIYSFEKKNPKLKNQLINQRKRKEPKEYCCVINQCFDKDTLELRRKRFKAMKHIPSIILYYGAENIRIIESLKRVKR